MCGITSLPTEQAHPQTLATTTRTSTTTTTTMDNNNNTISNPGVNKTKTIVTNTETKTLSDVLASTGRRRQRRSLRHEFLNKPL